MSQPGPDPAALAFAADLIMGLDPDSPVLLACHVHPDGDALGSMIGFGLALRRRGFTAVTASFPEPFTVPPAFAFLPGLNLLSPPDQVPTHPSLAMSFDASSPDRLGELVPALSAAPHWLVLDHHASNQGFGTTCLLDRAAAATVVVAAELISRLGVTLDPEIATSLYLGLATDTGSFRFASTTAPVFDLAAQLVRAGADPARISQQVFDTRPFGAVRMLAEVISRAELDQSAADGRGLVWTYATRADLGRHGQPVSTLESFMDVLRSAAQADVACLIKPGEPGEWSVSLRSRGAVDVGAVAVALGGGGHRFAAGFTGYGEPAEVVAAVRARLDRA